jgi:hypothetical protein
MEFFLKHVLPIIGLVLVLGLPFVYVILSGRFVKGITLVWFLSVVWFALLSMPVYNILYKSHKDLCVTYLPEGNYVVAAAVLSWIPGIIVSAAAILIRLVIQRFFLRKSGKLKKETSLENVK